jgi:beta-galactosidase/beta-glucuronidase
MDIPRPEYPRPGLRREDWLNLNGEWQFEIDRPGNRIEEGPPSLKALSRKITVPFPPESKLSGICETDFMNHVWYGRNVRVPSEWAEKVVLLNFGAVDYEARVWVNGREVGHHRGGYTPFTCDVTDAVDLDGSNEVVVGVLDDPRTKLQASGKQSPRRESFGCYYTRVTGIWQTVWMEAVPRTYVANLRLWPIEDATRICVEVTVKGKQEPSNVRATISLNGRDIASYRTEASSYPATFSMDVADLKKWSPEDPILYDLELGLTAENGGVDLMSSYFGVRKIGIRGNAIMLNGAKRFLRLVLDQGYYPDGVYTAPSDDALREDIELSMELGFDGARLHQKVFEPRFLYWADRLGYLVTGEFADWGADLSNPLARECLLGEWLEAIERDFNHPSIILWTPFNEREFKRSDTAIADFLRRAVKVTRLLDPTRPVIDASGYVHVETDVYDIHDYEQQPSTFRSHYDRFARTGLGQDLWVNSREDSVGYDGQPVMVSEYGGTWWNPGQPSESNGWGYGSRPSTVSEFLERYRSLTESLLFNPNISALCYTQLYDIEQEMNGLLYYERRPKFDPKEIRGINRQRAAMETG